MTHRERVSWPFWFHLLMAVGVVLSAIGAVAAYRDGVTGWPLWIVAFGGLVVLFVWWKMRWLDVVFGPDGVAYGFGCACNAVPPDRIDAVERERYQFTRYMGWGWRIGWQSGDRAYAILGHKEGVRVRYREEAGREREVFLSCAEPAAAIAAVERKET